MSERTRAARRPLVLALAKRKDRAMVVESVESEDGTRIACMRSGEGPPLVLVPGITGDHTHFAFLAPLLEPYFSLWIVHRRGRGRSGDGRTYAIEREFEDVAAVVDAIDDPVDVFAHSFGATVMLGAMPRARNLRRAVLYEPGAGVGAESAGFTDELEDLLARGEHKALLRRFHQEAADPTPEDMDRYLTSPDFDRDLALIGTITRECRAEDEWAYSPDAYRSLTPTLLLVGSESPRRAHQAIALAQAALPNSRTTVLHGHGHVAMWSEPELVARLLVEFLLRKEHPLHPGGDRAR
jgi:pimeloyl-ACP methyl ester carboxylesterase